VKFLSGRLALGPLCPAPTTSKFDDVWSRFRIYGFKQLPCQSADQSKSARRAAIAEVQGAEEVLLLRLT
jgi:hypothetical protein